MLRRFLPVLALIVLVPSVRAQQWLNPDADARTNRSMFRGLDPDLPTPNQYRTASGVPGPGYWQQQADYVIRASLDTTTHRISGTERITYHNNSPTALPFLWLQLDQNADSREHSRTNPATAALPENVSARARAFIANEPFNGGYNIRRVQVVQGSGAAARLVDAPHRVNGTVMRVDLPTPVASGRTVQFEVEWAFELPPNNVPVNNGRGVREQVKDGMLYEVAQWFPRMSVYDDVSGWQTDQFYGQGEFYLEFGNYDVSLTVPWNHIVDATGDLQNPTDTYTATQRQRLTQAYSGETPTFIIRADEVGTAASRPEDERHDHLALQGRERARLRVGVVQDVRDGRGGLPLPAGAEPPRQAPLALPARGDAAVGQGLHAGHRARRCAPTARWRSAIRTPRPSTCMGRCSAWSTR